MERPASSLTIVSFNIWDLPLWFVRKRKERVVASAQYFRDLGVDVICLQESFDTKHRALFYSALTGAGYHMTDRRPEDRRVPLARLDRTGGLVIFSKFPIIESSFIPFRRAVNVSAVEFFSRKGALLATLRTPMGNLRVVNTHLHMTSLVLDRRVRLHQLSWIFDRLREEERMPTILTGDFNEDRMLAESHFLELLVREGFSDPKEGVLEPSYRSENPYVNGIWANRTETSQRLDYIFCRDLGMLGSKVEGYHVLHTPEPLSDHDPILLALVPISR